MDPAQYHRHYLHSGQKLYLEIVRTKRKTLAMHVFPGERVTEVRAPLKCSWKEIDHFIEARLDWLLEARNKLALVPADPTFTSGQVHSVLGDAYRLTVYPGRTRVMLAPGEILLSCRDPASESQVQTAFYSFLRQQAETVFAVQALS